ncbi:CGH_1_HP_G0006210.mRNA.1.CDS.1 [Saccharomyces cerevisiae]|nr:CGH_1_HP_G0006210.mRNA.1.CDS.1 [Saccharomyces cerevisiae]CAI6989789.1 CGH_1_HP_G0006210.mRNA.1.CDS.1 [Saccharomyces cerevisiae]
MDTDKLISEAESHFSQGNHAEAVAKLTSAAQSNPNDEQMSTIESLIQKIAGYVMENRSGGSDASQDRAAGGGSSFMNTLMADSKGSSQTQLGKLALLATVMTHSSNKGSSNRGFDVGTVMSMLSGSGGGSQSMGASGLAALASQFFKSGNNSQGQGQGQGQGSFTALASLASSFMNSNNNNQQGQNQSSGGSSFGALASMASSFMHSNNNQNSNNSQQGYNQSYQNGNQNSQGYNNQQYQGGNGGYQQQQGQSGGAFSSLASMAQSYLGGGQTQSNQQQYNQQGQNNQQQYQQQGQNYQHQQQGQQQQQGHSSSFSALASMASSYLGNNSNSNSSYGGQQQANEYGRPQHNGQQQSNEYGRPQYGGNQNSNGQHESFNFSGNFSQQNNNGNQNRY